MNDPVCAGSSEFLIGAGIHDITGPAAEREMMGYVMFLPPQITAGIHTRLWSRAFVIASPCNGKRIAFVSADLGMVFQAVKQEVVERLKRRFGESLYGNENVVLSATHTHAGPGGYSHYLLYNLISLGFDRDNFEVIVDGIFQSICKAHDNLAPGKIAIAAGDLDNAARNRSADAYGLNADKEAYEFNTDHGMTLLRLTAGDGREVGTINWFAVHGTSLANDNGLISGDNKGLASYLFEREMGSDYAAPATFVAAFAQANEGDVSPNIYGPRGDGRDADQFESLEKSARRQFESARALFDGATEPLTGGVDYRHVHVDFSQVAVDGQWTQGAGPQTTCGSGIGLSKFAGTEDGPGIPLPEGISNEELQRRLDQALKRLLPRLPREWRQQIEKAIFVPPLKTECQAEKPVVIPAGDLKPVPWTPQVLPLQIVSIGRLAIIAVPFECTTMSGRRIRAVVEKRLAEVPGARCVIAGLANAYGGYVATREEYRKQDYEGASTEFGPWQLAAILQHMDRLAASLLAGAEIEAGPEPPEVTPELARQHTGAGIDLAPPSKKPGSVRSQPAGPYKRGETAVATFWSGHPNRATGKLASFLEVQRQQAGGWLTVARDWDAETRYGWRRLLLPALSPFSESRVEWRIPADAPAGTYRLVHKGYAKSVLGRVRAYSGISAAFQVD